ncbi:MAG: peptidylprolyl isomerase [Chitinophagaceae bacterium]
MIERLSFLLMVGFCLLSAGCKQQSQNANPHVVIKTAQGEIEIELYKDQAPKTVAAFLANVDSGKYENTFFYRVLNVTNQPSDASKAELIQGGLWKNKQKIAAGSPLIPHESTNQTHILHEDGTVSMSRLEPGTASTEFFICILPQPGFDYGGENNPDGQGYAAFGKVVKGMDVVLKIYDQPDTNSLFDPPIHIYSITRL